MNLAVVVMVGVAGVRLTEFVGGDADSSLEEAFEAWKKQAWLSLLLALGVDAESE